MSALVIDALNTTTNVAVSCYKGCWVFTLISISALGLSFKTYLHLSCISHSLPHACLEMTKNPLPCMCENQIRSFHLIRWRVCVHGKLTGQSVALRVILIPLTVEIQWAALAVGKLAAHLLVPHRTLSEVLHILQRQRKESWEKVSFYDRAPWTAVLKCLN